MLLPLYHLSDTFHSLADYVTDLGALVVSLDYRGHGRTGGQAGGNLGDIESFNYVYQDIQKLVIRYKKDFQIPFYFLGYDLGALIAVKTVLEYGLDARHYKEFKEFDKQAKRLIKNS